MSDVVTIRGFVASEIRSLTTPSGFPVAHFRLGSTERRFDKNANEWVDSATNWYSVSLFRGLAQNATSSINKGDRILVIGKLKIRQWDKDGRHGVSPEIDAESVGHDLVWGTAKFQRSSRSSSSTERSTGSAEGQSPQQNSAADDGGAASAGSDSQSGGTQDAGNQYSGNQSEATGQYSLVPMSSADQTDADSEDATESVGETGNAPDAYQEAEPERREKAGVPF